MDAPTDNARLPAKPFVKPAQTPAPVKPTQPVTKPVEKPRSFSQPERKPTAPPPRIFSPRPIPARENQPRESATAGAGFRSRDEAPGHITPHKVFELYEGGRRLYTKSILPGFAPFAERLVKQGPDEFRELDPRRSKLGAAVAKGATNAGIRKGDIVLYLGISHGYTASFVSDMVGKEGVVFGVDPAPRVIRDTMFLSEKRTNIIPILADANHTEEYVGRVCLADIVYQDIAQRNQADIFIQNCKLFLKKGGYGLLAVKARSVDVTRKPKDIFNEIRLQMEKTFTVIDFRILEPFEKDHCMIIVKK